MRRHRRIDRAAVEEARGRRLLPLAASDAAGALDRSRARVLSTLEACRARVAACERALDGCAARRAGHAAVGASSGERALPVA